MRISTLVVLLACATAPAGEPAAPSSEAARGAEAVALARKAAAEYTITTGGGAGLKLEPEPLLQWSNPVAGSIHGAVFVWTSRGCPKAVASIYKWYAPNHHLGVEFHSLSTVPVTASRAGRDTWTPARAGLTFKPIPGKHAPDGSHLRRQRQLQYLAQDFTAGETTRTGVTRQLRLLTKPVYRYESTDPDVLDGAIFAFVEGTDPEVVLIIEARRGPNGFAWHYAFARMNSLALRASHLGREVWTAPEIPWEQAFDGREPYALFIFAPGQGVNPPGPPDPPPGR